MCVGAGRDAVKIEIRYRRGLFQRDLLSPLLFCLCLAPLSHALNCNLEGYHCKVLGSTITDQLFMDDLKVYTRNEDKLNRALEVVDNLSETVVMKLGMCKCAVAHLVKKKLHVADCVLPDGQEIKSLNEGNIYNYLGINQVIQPQAGASSNASQNSM